MSQAADFFVSYTSADRAWAEWIAWELEAAGYTTVLQAWHMPPGSSFAHAMDQALQHSRHTLLVLSPAYLRSAMTQAEWRAGFVADPSGLQRRLLPVRVEACQPIGLLADRVYIDLVNLDDAAARLTLLEGVAANTALSVLGSLQRALGDLDRVTAWLMVYGMVNADPGYSQTTHAINGFSDLIVDLYGPEVGAHARVAVGMAALPLDNAVVIAAEVAVAD
jgi:hypothetical protein